VPLKCLIESKALYGAFRKTNNCRRDNNKRRYVQADFRLDGELRKLQSTGKLVIGPAGSITVILM
jgi:hypothetical protein